MKTILTIITIMFVVGCVPVAEPDVSGQLPGDIARAFIAAVQAEDYDKAASFFTKRSINEVQHSSTYDYSFEKYCAQFKNLDTFEIRPAVRCKVGYWLVTISGKRKGTEVGCGVWLEKVGGKWLLTEGELGFSWDEPETNEPYAQVVIKTYRFHSDRNGFPPSAGPDDTTILVHRIGHDRVIPDSDEGPFLSRISPGSYQIEYEVIKGKIDDQKITYPVVTQVFEAGKAYILDGYSITTNETLIVEPPP